MAESLPNVPRLPPEVFEMIMRQLDTGTLLACRRVSADWNKDALKLLRPRKISLLCDWYEREERTELLKLFPTIAATAWSSVLIPREFHSPNDYRQTFIDKFGPGILACRFESKAPTPRLLEILERMLNVEEITIFKTGKFFSDDGVGDFKLVNLKVLRFTCSSRAPANVHNLNQVLELSTHALEMVEIINVNIDDSTLRISSVLEHVPRVVLTIHRNFGFPTGSLNGIKWNITELTFPSYMFPYLSHPNLIPSLQSLTTLTLRSTLFDNGKCRIIRIPPLPALRSLRIGLVCCFEWVVKDEQLKLTVSCPIGPLPMLGTVTILHGRNIAKLPDRGMEDNEVGPCRIFGFSSLDQRKVPRILFRPAWHVRF